LACQKQTCHKNEYSPPLQGEGQGGDGYLRMSELRLQIQRAITNFTSGLTLDSTKALLNTLGYDSDRTAQLSPNNFNGFSEQFNVNESNFYPEKAKTKDWQSIDIIFQTTEDDIKKTQSLFQIKQVDNTIIESYLFFSLSLTGDKYTRSDLVRITREINRLTPMPAMILFQYNKYLTVSVIDRRLHKRESSKDVLEKVTLIKDINILKPHRAHIEILHDLSLQNLIPKYSVSNFVELHNAWRKSLDTSELNKKFYRELANWYFWAIQNVEFPDDAEQSRDIRNATSVIRLITRVIFVWFLKEKGLIPDDLFNKDKLKQILNYKDKNSTTYYKAILQNLFFATLNTEMNTKDKPDSKFRGKSKGDGRDQHYMIHNVFRYEDYFVNPQDALKKYFENIPFLNGGLFECLDKEAEAPNLEKGGKGGSSGKKIIRIDAFSDRSVNPLKVPDHLFFSSEQSIDLNETFGTKNKTYKVRGLIDILDSYKFTVDENTPIEEEVALDPELLGKVFENLLASYNPETGSTARKQTGSFYTPREIVNYMVDESLIAYLLSKLPTPLAGEGQGEGETRHSRESGNPEPKLRHLLSYTDKPHHFIHKEVDTLIEAIDNAKILDPACGSGAFPMGILHKLVYILGKLDPNNEKWKQKQISKVMEVPDTTVRERLIEDIEQSFQNNELDYGRKLYLIENCIFGVDIQPIAVQIAKLRFFISLIVDQKISYTSPPIAGGAVGGGNLGIRPLPNLETKFVAANTLIGIEKPQQLLLRNPEIDRKEEELKKVRERHFTARTPKTKEKYRKEDERLRSEIAELLKQDGFTRETTEKLAHWNPYDQNASANFFDPEWMFGIKDGFDVVIGNPPYGISLPKEMKDFFETFVWRGESYIAFIEKGMQLLNIGGQLSYIVPDTYLNLAFTDELRIYLLKNSKLREIVVLPGKVFDYATVDTTLLFAQRAHESKTYHESEVSVKQFEKRASGIDMRNHVSQSLISTAKWYEQGSFTVNSNSVEVGLITRVATQYRSVLDIAEMFYGIKAYQVGKGTPPQTKEILTNKPFTSATRKNNGFLPFYDGKHIGHYTLLWRNNNWLHYGPWLAEPRKPEKFTGEKILIRKIVSETLIATYVPETSYCNTLLYVLKIKSGISINYKYLLGILNSHFIGWYFRKKYFITAADTFPQIMISDIQQFPIPEAPPIKQAPIESLVDQILAAKKKDSNADTSAPERQIDEMVYKLYGLTPEEIAIVEGKG